MGAEDLKTVQTDIFIVAVVLAALAEAGESSFHGFCHRESPTKTRGIQTVVTCAGMNFRRAGAVI
jgi:hypothetical protein